MTKKSLFALMIPALYACTTAESSPVPATGAGVVAIDPWEPIDPGFVGCEDG